MEKTPVLDERETKIRKQWLQFFIPLTIFNCLYILYVGDHPTSQFPSYWKYLTMGTAILFIAIQFYFIYMKYGTKWLTYILIVNPLSNAYAIYYMIKNPIFNVNPLLQTIALVLSTLYLIPCYRLRKVNKRIQTERKQQIS